LKSFHFEKEREKKLKFLFFYSCLAPGKKRPVIFLEEFDRKELVDFCCIKCLGIYSVIKFLKIYRDFSLSNHQNGNISSNEKLLSLRI